VNEQESVVMGADRKDVLLTVEPDGTVVLSARSVDTPPLGVCDVVVASCSGSIAPGSTQPLTEMSPGNLLGLKGSRSTPEADNLTAICEPIACNTWQAGSLHDLLQG
jgi:hypothetical protein